MFENLLANLDVATVAALVPDRMKEHVFGMLSETAENIANISQKLNALNERMAKIEESLIRVENAALVSLAVELEDKDEEVPDLDVPPETVVVAEPEIHGKDFPHETEEA